MSSTVTDALIIKSTGQYDKEVVQRLRIEGVGIQRISNLEECFNLVDLSLSRNEIGAITGLSHLVNLKRLDLSFNKIRKIEGLAELFSLQYLDLRANAISSVNDVDELKLLPALQTLHLQSSDGEDSNPACKHPSYITIVMRCLPQLQILDGGQLNITESFLKLEDHLKQLQPDPADSATPPQQPWLDGLLPAEGDAGEFLVPSSEEDVEAVLFNNKRFREVQSAHTAVSDMLAEECSHLLRRAQAALAKAGTSGNGSGTGTGIGTGSK